ncbi:hypothetical protein FACS1894186_6020 [Alphaproteobacteria bacterium]|nr:hypothetical protein FACS1894186_6020 [Alphaproteobacteria bacterium]
MPEKSTVHVKSHTREGRKVCAYDRARPGVGANIVHGTIKETTRTLVGTVGVPRTLYNAYKKMAPQKISDKYKHAYVSCKGSQKGAIGAIATLNLGAAREIFQIATGANTISASKQDMKANIYGAKMGLAFPNKDCDDLVKGKYPKK